LLTRAHHGRPPRAWASDAPAPGMQTHGTGERSCFAPALPSLAPQLDRGYGLGDSTAKGRDAMKRTLLVLITTGMLGFGSGARAADAAPKPDCTEKQKAVDDAKAAEKT